MSTTRNPDIRRVNGKLQMSQDKKTTSFLVEKESDAYGFHGLQRYCTSRIFARRSVNKEYYWGIMRRLREAVRQKKKDLWANNSWILHYDNVSSHNAIIIRKFLTKNETNTIQQPSNSPDIFLRYFSVRSSQKTIMGNTF